MLFSMVHMKKFLHRKTMRYAVWGGLFCGVAVVLVLSNLLPRNHTRAVVIHADAEAATTYIEVEAFADGFTRPVQVVSSGVEGDGRLFVVEQNGVIWIANPDGSVRPQPFLDLSNRVDNSRRAYGLRGLAFHPDYASNGYFFVNYIALVGETRYVYIARYKAAPGGNTASLNSENVLLSVVQPGSAHFAGDLAFGPDGYLYIPFGDGYDSVTVTNSSQEPDTLLGKIARIDVDEVAGVAADCFGRGSGDYTIPADNPYIAAAGTCAEIWASGLRNPWRFDFDPLTGDLFLPDPGQDRWDELNWRPSTSTGGENYGWPCYEGNAALDTSGCAAAGSYTFPVLDFAIGADGHCSIIGGAVYRGSQYPALWGRYFAADFCSGTIYEIEQDAQMKWQIQPYPILLPAGVVSFGRDEQGELLLVNRDNGTVYRLIGSGEDETTATPTGTATPIGTATPTGTVTLLPSPTSTEAAQPTQSATATATRVVEPDGRLFLPFVVK